MHEAGEKSNFERSDVKEKRPEEKSESYIKLFQPLISIHDSSFSFTNALSSSILASGSMS